MKDNFYRLALSTLLMLSCIDSARASAAIFTDCSLEQAKQKAQQEHKFLLVDFMASWCPPCRQMKSSTWTNDSVDSWVKENAIAVQIDVDKQRDLSQAMHIEAMPTLVLFTPQSGNAEFGRQVGAMSASELLYWLKEAQSGKPAEQAEKSVESKDDSAVWKMVTDTRQAMMSQQNEVALQGYVWIWTNVAKDDQTFADIRTKAVPVEMKQLCAAYPAAKVKFAEMRDAADKAGDRADWLILNEVLGDSARTLAWFDKAKLDAKQRETIATNSSLLEPSLFANYRYADACTYLYKDPLAKISQLYKRAEDMKKPRPETEISSAFDPFPSMVLLVYGAYVGAGREAEAKTIADECLRLDDTPIMHQALDNMAKGTRTARALTNKPVAKVH